MFQVESAEDVEQLISLKVPIDWELITREWAINTPVLSALIYLVVLEYW
jgi:hypothetical protein